VPDEKFKVYVIPVDFSLQYRFNYFKNQPIIPFIGGGVDYYYFSEKQLSEKRTVVSGWKRGYHGNAGFRFNLNRIDPKHAGNLKVDYGIENVYLDFDAKYARVNNFGEEKGVDWTGLTFGLSFLFEF